MSLKKLSEFAATLAFRLTLRYAVLFIFSSFIVFLISYLFLKTFINTHSEGGLLDDFREYAFIFETNGLEALKKDILMENQVEGEDKVFNRIISENGEVLLSSDMAYWGDIPFKSVHDKTTPVFRLLTVPGHKYRAIALYGSIGSGITLQLGKSLEEDERFLERLKEFFVASMGMIMVLAAWIGWFMAKKALSGVQEVTRAAEEISGGDFKRRVVIKGQEMEIKRLTDTFNGMIDRIQLLITGMREMNDNIAHDLRSPITRIRGAAEMAMLGSVYPDDYETMAAGTIEECDRILSMINTMLDISEAETGTASLKRSEVDIGEVAREAIEIFEPMAEEKKIKLHSKIESFCLVDGDKQKLQRLIANIMDNAIKYSPDRGDVMVEVEKTDMQVTIAVADNGIGIDASDMPHIFERFYRCDKSRSKTGIGLGLSLARAITIAHGGEINLSSSPGKGSTFRISLPAKKISD